MSTILVVDDSATDRRLIGGLLERKGFSVRYAENGTGALRQLERTPPDAVVTDMQMPQMNGLDLVRAMRARYPHIPVILMTGQGSEALAAQALQQGAASYVPKSKLNYLLIESVDHVLELARAEGNYQRLIDHAMITDFHFQLVNDPELIEPLVCLVQQMVAGMGVCDATSRLQVGVALEQAILNAIYHGNLELTSEQLRRQEEAASGNGNDELIRQRLDEPPYKDRKCYVRALITREEARFVVRDEGTGFDVRNKLQVSLADSPEDPAGRGLVLMWGLMDKVAFNKAGNEVTLIKRRSQPLTFVEPEEPAQETPGTAVETPRVPDLKSYGELISIDGGESITLTKPRLSVGRHPSCDVVLSFSDVSHQHCLLYMYSGWWYVKDLKSSNGVRINRMLVDQRRISPGAVLSIGAHNYEVRYNPGDLGAVGITPPVDPF